MVCINSKTLHLQIDAFLSVSRSKTRGAFLEMSPPGRFELNDIPQVLG